MVYKGCKGGSSGVLRRLLWRREADACAPRGLGRQVRFIVQPVSPYRDAWGKVDAKAQLGIWGQNPQKKDATVVLTEAEKVAQPTWREMLKVANDQEELSPPACVACITEMSTSAEADGDVQAFARSEGLAVLLKRVGARSFGFSSREHYLLLSFLHRAPGLMVACKEARKLHQRCVEEMEDSINLRELSAIQLAHLGLLLPRVAQSASAWAAWRGELRYRLEQMTSKQLCFACEGLARAPTLSGVREDVALLEAAREATLTILDEFSPTQLASLALYWADLAPAEVKPLSDIFSRLQISADQLTVPKLTEVWLAVAALRAQSLQNT
eukprot:TRINITY_DN25263_c0_g1_i1.p1 TRINITY_DN25263_c0_g1~~TRINITY_DN25263_c0_g1_i1.p1  ORF type:complete len:327 (-),score=73.27 TRINITY_DN25263_c0_g1_i1:575-1555(-)